MKTRIKLLCRLVLVLGCSYGMLMMLGLLSGQFDSSQLIFYTIQSNLVILFSYGYLLLKSLLASRKALTLVAVDFNATIMGALTLMILVTGLIYNFVLAPQMPADAAYSVNNWSNFLAHTFTPVMVFIDWLFFADKSTLTKLSPVTWVIIPLAYWLFSIVRAPIGGAIPQLGNQSRYPYFFIDSDLYGWSRMLLNVLGLVIAFIVLGYILYGISLLQKKVVGAIQSSS